MDLPKDVPNFLLKGRVFVLNVTGNPLEFSTLNPVSTIVGTELDNLDGLNQALHGGTGKIDPRNKALGIAEGSLMNWSSQVTVLVRNLTNYLDKVALIHLFGARVKVNGKFIKPPFAVTNPSPGVVEMVKTKVPDSVNEYQVSYDLGVTWDGEDLAATKLNKVSVPGFVKGSTPFLRTRANLGFVKGKWLIESIIITQ